jgi:phage shock protein A
MGIFDRLRRLTAARVEAALSTVEDPEVLYPQLIREMEGKIRAATEAEAAAVASVKATQREVGDLQTKIARMQKGAELALGKGDEKTARDAMSAQIKLEADLQRREAQIPRLEQAVENAKDARKQIQSQLDELRDKKDEILSRARVAKNQKKIAKTVHGKAASAQSILDTASQLEGKVEETEAQLDIQREIASESGGGSLDKRLKDLEKSASIEDRMAALKQKLGSK